MPRSYVAGVAAAIEPAGLPYGFTLTVFCSGQGLVHFHGPPQVEFLFLFAAGSATAFGLMRWLSYGARRARTPQLAASAHPVRAGVIHVSAIGLAIGSASAMGLLPEAVAWPMAALAATLVYFSVTAVELSFSPGDRG